MILWNVKRISSFFQCCYQKQLFLNPLKHFPQHVHCVLQYTCSLRCDLEVTRSSKRAEDVQFEWNFFRRKNLLTENKSVFSLVPRRSAQQQTRRWDRRTNGRTLDRFAGPAPHAMRAVSIKFPSVSRWNAASSCSQGLSSERPDLIQRHEHSL